MVVLKQKLVDVGRWQRAGPRQRGRSRDEYAIAELANGARKRNRPNRAIENADPIRVLLVDDERKVVL